MPMPMPMPVAAPPAFPSRPVASSPPHPSRGSRGEKLGMGILPGSLLPLPLLLLIILPVSPSPSFPSRGAIPFVPSPRFSRFSRSAGPAAIVGAGPPPMVEVSVRFPSPPPPPPHRELAAEDAAASAAPPGSARIDGRGRARSAHFGPVLNFGRCILNLLRGGGTIITRARVSTVRVV